jgi:hypothetical protein
VGHGLLMENLLVIAHAPSLHLHRFAPGVQPIGNIISG